ncbi:MAG: MATE family efflux transporter [Candidatus Cloacimonetes bacterium]|nr:MATE family efflux transporter [Candidatus Cloacimonadota bacterium]
MIFAMMSMVAFNLVDTFYVGKLGTNELAALSFTFPVILVVVSIALGLGMGTSAVISRAIGEGDHYKVQRLTTDGLLLALLVVLCFVIIGFLTIEPLFKILGATPIILPLIKKYMSIWYAGMPFVVVPMVGNNAIRATGDTKTPSAIMMVAVTVNFIMDPLLIFGIGPFPKLGIAGAAISTVIARFITFSVALWVLAIRDKMISFILPKFNRILQSWKSILFIGVPIAGARIITPLSIGVITSIIAGYGPKAVAGFGVASRIEFFALAVIRALSSVFGPFVGQNIGAKKYNRVEKGIIFSKRFAILWGAIMFIILVLSSRPIASIFNKDPDVISTIILYLSIVPIGYGLQGILLICNTSLNVLRKPLQAAGLIITQMFILYIPLAYLGSYLFGIKGIFSGIALAYLIAGIIAHFVLKKHLISIKKNME